MICAPAEARPAFRVGVRERSGRERSEDGADDHGSERQTRSLWRDSRASTVSRGVAGPFSDDDSERTAVIARCGMERSAACRSEDQGKQRVMTASLKKGSKVFELLEGGAAARKAGRRKLKVFAPLRVSIDSPKTSIDYR